MVITQDSLEFLQKQVDFENDIIFADPPYALGSEVIIRQDGKVDYAKANDFMNKWEMPTGDYWEKWFIEAYRTLKHGGYLLMYGMDRQLLLFKYYASLAGFQEQQSIYWYYISNFPKATDLSKMIDKNAGVEREVIGKTQGVGSTNNKFTYLSGHKTEYDTTKSSTDLAKKYEGYKYSISPLKQTNETIMVFKKPNKTGSVLHDTLAMENGDDTITCSALNIDGNRVATDDKWEVKEKKHTNAHEGYQRKNKSMFTDKEPSAMHENGRYPAQTFIDSQVAEKLDLQSGVSKSTGGRIGNKGSALNMTGTNYEKGDAGYGDIAGCSKILHKCDFTDKELVYIDFENDADYVWSELTNQWKNENELRNWLDDYFMKDITIDFNFKDYQRIIIDSDRKIIVPLIEKCDFENEELNLDLFIYEPKVSGGERNNGLDGMEKKQYSHDGRDKPIENAYQRNNSVAQNNHPTLKPIDLNYKILKLFKTPNDQRICYPFAGSGSEIIGGLKANFQNWTACEINQDYVDIANARIKHYKENEYIQLSLL